MDCGCSRTRVSSWRGVLPQSIPHNPFSTCRWNVECGVQMFGPDHEGANATGMVLLDPAQRLARDLAVIDQQGVCLALRQVEGEEPGGAGGKRAAESGQGSPLATRGFASG